MAVAAHALGVLNLREAFGDKQSAERILVQTSAEGTGAMSETVGGGRLLGCGSGTVAEISSSVRYEDWTGNRAKAVPLVSPSSISPAPGAHALVRASARQSAATSTRL
jgi:hypothetical protein